MIEIVKIQGDGYLVDGTMVVPKAEGNRHYEEVKQFIAEGGVVEDEFTAEELITQAQVADNAEAVNYLTSTDWYVIRLQETGKAIPEEVTLARVAARNNIK